VAASIFGTTLVLLYATSSAYHIVPKHNPWKARLQILDHVMIFFLIAGTYTPITLITLRGAWGWSMFGTIWGLALLGVLFKSIPYIRKNIPHAVIVVIYAIMGWSALVAIVPLAKILSGGALALLFSGGAAYSLGIIFFALDTLVERKSVWYGHHEIWHLFVIAGSVCHFCLIYIYLLSV
jgi:hemolysin III